jgi:hypothetical protein
MLLGVCVTSTDICLISLMLPRHGPQEMNRTLGDMGHGGGAGSGQPLSDPFQMGGLLGSLLGVGLQMSGGGQEYSNQTPVLSSNQVRAAGASQQNPICL